MNTGKHSTPRSLNRSPAALSLALALLSPAWAQAAEPSAGQAGSFSKTFEATINVQELAKLQDIGLPAYPGAVAQQDDKDDKPGATVALSVGPFGFKLLVSKFSSADSIDGISAFYREALGQHGPVLDCSHGSPAALAAKAEKKQKASGQGCGDISSDPGERIYKTGTSKNFRLVSLKPVNAHQVHFQMMRMELRGL